MALSAHAGGRQPMRAHALSKEASAGASSGATCRSTSGLRGPTTALPLFVLRTASSTSPVVKGTLRVAACWEAGISCRPGGITGGCAGTGRLGGATPSSCWKCCCHWSARRCAAAAGRLGRKREKNSLGLSCSRRARRWPCSWRRCRRSTCAWRRSRVLRRATCTQSRRRVACRNWRRRRISSTDL